jgi:crotonobetainyl-CoA:carnitine CoA-transferase CaiB-like acyl-CoA transferase
MVGFAVAVAASLLMAPWRIAVASGLAFIVSQGLDIAVFNRWRQSSWWKAPFLGSFVASVVDTAIFFFVAFAGTELDWRTLAAGDLGVAIADLMTGMYSTVAILTALHERARSGKGQYIDMALLDTQVAWLANQNANYLIGGKPPRRMGNSHPNVVPYDAFRTRDGDMILAIGNDGQFRRFCLAAGVPDVPDDPRFIDNAARIANREACIGAIAPAILTKTTAEWIALLEPLGVPCGPINRLDEV